MRRYGITLLALWLLGGAVGAIYAGQNELAAGVAVPVLLALLLELSFYAGLAFGEIRNRLERLGRRLPWLLLASVAGPYLVAGVPTGIFGWREFALLLALGAALAWWYRVLPHQAAPDVAFLVVVAAVYMARIFHWIYADPVVGLRIDILGQLVWIRLGVTAILLMRHLPGTGFGFWPERREWLIGVRHFALLMPLAIALMYSLAFGHFEPAAGWWWKAPGTFLGFLWVVALAEELFFRGLLQQMLSGWLGLRAGLVAAAVVFGACHLPFRAFPNWPFATLAAVAGWFYGRAFIEGRGVRAAMVAHALTVTVWRTLFR